MLTYLLQGLKLGFSAGVQPGPFQAYLVNQSLRNGWRRMLAAAFAPLLSDGPIVALVLLALAHVPAWFERVLYLAGGLYMIWLAWGAFQQWHDFSPAPAAPTPQSQRVWRAVLVNALSPGPYIFWSLVCGPIVLRAWHAGWMHALAFLLGFYGLMIGINLSVVVAAGTAGQVNPRIQRALMGFSVLAMGIFGLSQMWRGFHG